jgi:KDO2-lipid IV(A) lauroyltransferase
MSTTPPPADSSPPFRAALLHPRFWLSWFMLGLLRLIVLMPIPLLLGGGRLLGLAAGQVARGRRHVVRTNLRLCFPELDARERERLVNAHFAAIGAGIFETLLAWFASDARLLPRFEVEGQEHLRAVQASGQGVLLLTGHFTTLEIGARILCSVVRLPFHAMYRPYNNDLFDYFMHRWRERRSGLPALPKQDLRRLVKALREGRAIWYGPDQALDRSVSVFVPFFGVPTLTLAASGRLAGMGRARVLPFFTERTTRGWKLRFHPALEDFPSGDEATDARRINQALEQGIRTAMPEYFWIHRRFKRRPPGEPSVY